MENRFPLLLTLVVVLAFGATWVLTDSPAPAAQAAAPQPTASGQSDFVHFKNCDQVRAAGRAPLMAGRPGYNSDLDPDGTGVACPPN